MRHVSVGITTPPATDPVTLADAKEHLRVTHSAEDDYITGLVGAATAWCEKWTRRQFVTATATANFARWPSRSDHWELPLPPYSSFTSVQYTKADGTLETVSGVPAWLTGYARDGVQSFAPNSVTSPALDTTLPSPVSVVYVCGYGAAGAVPASIRHAIKMLAGHWYENRENVLVGAPSKEIEFSAQSLLSPYTLRNQP